MDPFAASAAKTVDLSAQSTPPAPGPSQLPEPPVTPAPGPVSPPPEPNPTLAGPSPFQPPPPPPSRENFGFLKGTGAKVLILVLILLIPASVYIAVNYKTFFKPQAQAACTPGVDYYFEVLGHSPNFENGTFVPSDKAWERVRVTNNCSGPVTLYKFKYWCTGIDKHRNDYWGFCAENGNEEAQEIPAGTQGLEVYIEQLVANTGSCGSAQTDLQLGSNIPDDPNLIYAKTIFGVAAAADNVCATAFSCESITLSPTGTTIAGASEKREMTASAVGGTTPYTYSWANTTTTGGGKGTFDKTTEQIVNWTAPATLLNQHTWDFTVTVTDATGATDSCTAALAYSKTNTYTFKTCESNACVTKDCNPKTTDCSKNSNCTSDTDCKQTHTYKTCENEACVSKDCSPKTTPCASSADCKTNTDCKPSTQTHKECRNEACVSISGAGSNTCTSDASCKPAATAPVTPQAGSPLPTILTVGAGALLTILGAAFLF